jgi:hypothetical protein
MSIELEYLRALRANDATPQAAARAAARAVLLERIQAAERTAVAPARHVLGRPTVFARRRLLAGGVSLGLAGLVAAAFALLVGVGPRSVETSGAAAAQLLQRAAKVAAEAPDVVLSPGQYWYTRSDETTLETTVLGKGQSFSALMPVRREAWIGPNGNGRVLEHAGPARFPTPGDRASWIAAGRPDLGDSRVTDTPLGNADASTSVGIVAFGSGSLTYEQLRALPTSVDALYARVAEAAHENQNSHGDAHEMFTIVGDVLREAPVPPALRAALYRVAARIPGVELIDHARDTAGRSGVAVALGEPGERSELIFDSRTAVLLGERETTDGKPANESAYLESGVVSSTNARP